VRLESGLEARQPAATVKRSGQYKRRVLLAVSGLSPQIVTETVHALAVDAFVEERIFLADL
jgi:hypothetical protein